MSRFFNKNENKYQPFQKAILEKWFSHDKMNNDISPVFIS